ncbi:MAG TPA: hypothetical protein VFN93_01660 [Gaiellaceae bacterium]|nr:hypothetical protein [Gaiellaceae bacterium]
MDRDALARAGRRAQAEEALLFEREREEALRRQLAELALEEEGPRVDAEAFAALDEDEVRRVRAALGQFEAPELDDDPSFLDDLYVDLADEPEDLEDEATRLEREIDESLRTQAALGRFIAALSASAESAEKNRSASQRDSV